MHREHKKWDFVKRVILKDKRFDIYEDYDGVWWFHDKMEHK